MRVLVIGAGIAGLTLGLRLRESGHDVVLMERSSELRDDGYMIDFFGPGYDTAERMGLLPDLAAIHYPIRRLLFVDRRGRPTADLSYPTLRRKVFRDRHFNFMRGELEHVLFAKFTSIGGIVLFGTSPALIESTQTDVVVVDSNGSHDRFDVVAGADGARSHVRELAFGPDGWRFLELGCHTAAFIVNEVMEGLPADAFVSMSRGGITVGAYPIRGQRTATFFVYRAAGPMRDRSRGASRRELEAAFRGRGWIVDRLLDAIPASSGFYFDDVFQVRARRWHRGRVVLVGDACGCVSLVAGQGASMAMAGAYVLAEELSRNAGDMTAALASYEARVRPAVEARQRSGRRNASWFLPRGDIAARLRDWAMSAAVKSPFASALGASLGANPLSE